MAPAARNRARRARPGPPRRGRQIRPFGAGSLYF